MKNLILIATVAVVSILASCGAKTSCKCTDKNGKIDIDVYASDFYTSSLSASDRTILCNAANIKSRKEGGICEEN